MKLYDTPAQIQYWVDPTKGATTCLIYHYKTLSDMGQKLIETLDGLPIYLSNLIELNEYLECCIKLLYIEHFIYVVKYFRSAIGPMNRRKTG